MTSSGITLPLISMPSRLASSRSRSAAVIFSIGNNEVSTALTPSRRSDPGDVVGGVAEPPARRVVHVRLRDMPEAARHRGNVDRGVAAADDDDALGCRVDSNRD